MEYWLEVAAIGSLILGGVGLALTPFAVLRGFRLLAKELLLGLRGRLGD